MVPELITLFLPFQVTQMAGAEAVALSHQRLDMPLADTLSQRNLGRMLS